MLNLHIGDDLPIWSNIYFISTIANSFSVKPAQIALSLLAFYRLCDLP